MGGNQRPRDACVEIGGAKSQRDNSCMMQCQIIGLFVGEEWVRALAAAALK